MFSPDKQNKNILSEEKKQEISEPIIASVQASMRELIGDGVLEEAKPEADEELSAPITKTAGFTSGAAYEAAITGTETGADFNSVAATRDEIFNAVKGFAASEEKNETPAAPPAQETKEELTHDEPLESEVEEALSPPEELVPELDADLEGLNEEEEPLLEEEIEPELSESQEAAPESLGERQETEEEVEVEKDQEIDDALSKLETLLSLEYS